MAITADIYIEFIENHLTALKAGKYKFSGTQVLAGAGIGSGDNFSINLPDFEVKVEGERFNLNPKEIVSVFPPSNSLGHYSNVLPHIALDRDTLPWERMIAMSSDDNKQDRLEKLPWLALLVLNQDEVLTDKGEKPTSVKDQQEAEDGYVKTVSQLEKDTIKGNNWPPRLDDDEKKDEKFKVVYVKKEALKNLLPDDKGLYWLAHARKSRIGLKGVKAGQKIEVSNEKKVLVHSEIALRDNCSIHSGELEAGKYTIKVGSEEVDLQLKPSDQIGDETAIVVANRLPKEGTKSVIHLVSLEGRYKEEDGKFVFDFGDYDDAVPLVSLHHWSFTSLTEKETFRHILLHLNHPFLFGVNREGLPKTLTVEALKSGFLASRYPLSDQAKIVDQAIKELRDKDHCYYFGQSGAIYNAGGKKIADGNGSVPNDQAAATGLIPGHRLHETSTFGEVTAPQLWIKDGNRLYYLSEDKNTHRLLVHLIPTDDTTSLRLPSREGDRAQIEKANHFLQQGYVPLPHYFRRGGKSISWYRSPLLAGKAEKQIPDGQFPVHTADELLRYDKNYGMFDASYAAAWELGRLLCLKNKRISLSLYRWKRTHVRMLKSMEQQHLHPHLPFRANAPGKIVLPENVEKWISDISLLKGLPFSYLVPDEKMLPPESLRFFYLDPSWIASLVDGALSIGRVNKPHDEVVHKQMLVDSENIQQSEVVSGILLRSSVVKGWPNLQVNAYNHSFPEGSEDAKNENISEEKELFCLRRIRLSDNLLLCLFKGDLTVLDLHEKPETVHFGFHVEDTIDSALRYTKHPIQADGKESDTSLQPIGDHDYFDEKTRVIDPTILSQSIKEVKDIGYKNFTSAQFALSLIEGVSRVRFIAPKS